MYRAIDVSNFTGPFAPLSGPDLRDAARLVIINTHDPAIAALQAVKYRGTLTNDLYNYPLLEDGARWNALPIREVEMQLGISSSGGQA